MQLPSTSQRKSLVARTLRYHEQLRSPEGAPLYDYLRGSRKLSDETIDHFLLGAVLDPDGSDEPARGRISIPFLTPSGPVALRFRRPPDSEDGPKYWQPAGSHITMFNTPALLIDGTAVVITEGEIDCMTLRQCGIPAVGIPGASNWKPHFEPLFEGFDRVIITADNDGAGDQGDDGAGKKFANKVAAVVPGPEVLLLPEGYDINGLFVAEGTEAVREFIGFNRKADRGQ